jgi:hypothetical protein
MTSKIKVDNITNQSDSNIVNKCGTTITLGASGDTINLAAGASQTGFGRTGTVDWDTTAKTASFTAVSGNGYFVNTTSGAITVTLPTSPSAGDIVSISDYAGTAATNNITIARNGSNFEGGTADGEIIVNRQAVTLIYVDGTQGWVPTAESDSSFQGPAFVTATGGTETTSPCGDYKIHTFTGPGTFCVSCAGNAAGSNTVDYLIVAGGGGSGVTGGGGGAGGFRESCGGASGCYTTSPLANPCGALPVTIQGYSITVGGGGGGGVVSPSAGQSGCRGSNSIFSSIISTGGGGGHGYSNGSSALTNPGGSGGGGAADDTGGTGNTPPVSPPQGQNGGTGGVDTGPGYAGAGGGGAGATGSNGNSNTAGGNGGNGVASSITGSSVTRAGGGGGGIWDNKPGGSGGSGGGGNANSGSAAGDAGTANTGGGAGGPTSNNQGDYGPAGSTGGSGIVIIRYKFQ